jgi:hypothetical protein
MRRFLNRTVALPLACTLLACGGSETPDTDTPVLAQSVRVEGCAVDTDGRALPGARIVAVQGDGRAGNETLTDHEGHYTLSVPARSHVQLRSGDATPLLEPLTLMTGSHHVSLGACLRFEVASAA